MERVRRLLGFLIVLVVAGAVVLVVVVRPGLRHDAESVDRSWTPLVRPLDVRYQALDGVVAQLKNSGAGNRNATQGLIQLVQRWRVIRSGTDTADQVETANRIEALAARANVLAHTARLASAAPLQAALKAFDASRPAADVLGAYNNQVSAYQDRRDGFWSRIVASLDGYPMRPTLQLVS
jgi:hypothetical protein